MNYRSIIPTIVGALLAITASTTFAVTGEKTYIVSKNQVFEVTKVSDWSGPHPVPVMDTRGLNDLIEKLTDTDTKQASTWRLLNRPSEAMPKRMAVMVVKDFERRSDGVEPSERVFMPLPG